MAGEDTIQLRRHRGLILQFVRNNHYNQKSRMDDLALWGLLMDMGCSVGQNYAVTLIQELRDAGYLTYKEDFRALTGTTRLEQIQITSDGRRLVERYKEDPLVLIP
jgi:hypothetical protein